jgi:hypothetical protein
MYLQQAFRKRTRAAGAYYPAFDEEKLASLTIHHTVPGRRRARIDPEDPH